MSGPKLEIPEISGKTIVVPESIQIGDFVVARYKSSEWSRYLPWEDFDHVALVSQINPLKIIEVSGIILQKEIREGVVEYELKKQRSVALPDGTKNSNGNLWMLDDLLDSPRSRTYFIWRKNEE